MWPITAEFCILPLVKFNLYHYGHCSYTSYHIIVVNEHGKVVNKYILFYILYCALMVFI